MTNAAALTYPAHGNPTAEARAQRRVYWREALKRWRKSGLSMAEFCKGENLKDSTLNWWARQLKVRDCDRAAVKPKTQRSSRAAFVPVRVIQVATAEGSSTLEVVTRSGHVIRLKPGFDAAMLRSVVAALESQPC